MAAVTCHANAGVLLSSPLSSSIGICRRSPLLGLLPARRSCRNQAARRAQICAKLYTVAPGDTLWKIAQREGVKLAALKDENLEILNPDKIYPGQTIHITGELHTTTQQAHTHVTPEQKTIGVSIAVVLLGAAIYFFFKSKNSEPEVVVER